MQDLSSFINEVQRDTEATEVINIIEESIGNLSMVINMYVLSVVLFMIAGSNTMCKNLVLSQKHKKVQ